MKTSLERPVDQLGTQATDTPDTKVVMGGLDLGAIVGRSPDGRSAAGRFIRPETAGGGVVGWDTSGSV